MKRIESLLKIAGMKFNL